MLTESKAYEIAFLVKNPEAEKDVLDLIGQYRGALLNRAPVKEVKLAYPIKKRTSAYFGYVQFELAPADIVKISETLKLKSDIVRFLVITPPVSKKPMERLERRGRDEERRPTVKSAAVPNSALTNEALEEKLEEILK